jgi:hypothetical protein
MTSVIFVMSVLLVVLSLAFLGRWLFSPRLPAGPSSAFLGVHIIGRLGEGCGSVREPSTSRPRERLVENQQVGAHRGHEGNVVNERPFPLADIFRLDPEEDSHSG